jgi:nicotinate-nucleotide adenylyltransferase
VKIGILGGTFDPIHNAHLAIAEEAKTRLVLSEVLFIPAGQPWMKTDTGISPANHRVEMVRLAIEGRPYFRLSMIEVEHKGPSYTVDTIAKLKKQSGGSSEFYFIIGWDALAQLPRWKEPARLIKMCRLVVFPRPGFPRPDIKLLEKSVPDLSKRVILRDTPEIDISATEIREKIARKLSISRLVPQKVAQYIEENGLYRNLKS